MKKLLLLFIVVFIFNCTKEVEVVGCMEINACNYNPQATTPSGICDVDADISNPCILMTCSACCVIPGYPCPIFNEEEEMVTGFGVWSDNCLECVQ